MTYKLYCKRIYFPILFVDMVPLFFLLGNLLQLMVIRDSEAHLDGQCIFAKTYSIFDDKALRDPRQSKEGTFQLERITDPDYYGFLSLEEPFIGFTYTDDGLKHLSDDEVEQLIEQIKA
jgi:hypothetical protein